MTLARMTPRPWLALVLLMVAVAACGGPRTKQQRQSHGERRTDEAMLLLNEAERELMNLEADRAEPKLAKAKEVLAHPDVDLSPEGEMLRSQLAELRARIPQVRQARARREREAEEARVRRELEAAEEKQRDLILQAMSEVSEALEALERKDAGGAQVEAVYAAVKRVREKLEAGKALEEKSEDYSASARSTERRLTQAEARARLAQRMSDFLSGPVSERREATELEKKAKKERDPDTRLTLYMDARERLQRCGEDAEKLLAEAPELARNSFAVEGRPTTIRAVGTSCRAKAGALQKVVAKLEKAKAAQEKAKAAKEQKARARKGK